MDGVMRFDKAERWLGDAAGGTIRFLLYCQLGAEMRSPFPGMDPFVEARGLWSDFHDSLIVELRRTLNATLPPRYEALVEERTYIDVVEPLEGTRKPAVIKPDVRIDKQSEAPRQEWRGSGGQAVLSVPVIMHPQLELEESESFIEVHDTSRGDRVVTCIEVLSPSNKWAGSVGWGEYERKRQLMLHGAANFVEIDLLRCGRRRAMREPWPNSPYYVLVMKKIEAPRCHVFPAFSHQRLPAIPVPLAEGDADLNCDLQAAVGAVFASSRYERRLAYDMPIDPPLAAEERVFLSAASA
jgi:hypothetical protein